jgi:hypothetical protein
LSFSADPTYVPILYGFLENEFAFLNSFFARKYQQKHIKHWQKTTFRIFWNLPYKKSPIQMK